jgi:hypothetical protein
MAKVDASHRTHHEIIEDSMERAHPSWRPSIPWQIKRLKGFLPVLKTQR